MSSNISLTDINEYHQILIITSTRLGTLTKKFTASIRRKNSGGEWDLGGGYWFMQAMSQPSGDSKCGYKEPLPISSLSSPAPSLF
jgi:hypothetical protein